MVMRGRRARALVMVCSLVVAACGGSGGDGGSPPTTDEAPATSTSTAPTETSAAPVTLDPGGIEAITISAGDLEFDALTAGPSDGELVLFLHGFPQTGAMWLPQLEAFAAAGYRAVAPNQRGYSAGARPSGTAAYALDEVAADVLAMADALGADQFHLVGHDFGGAAAWELAAEAFERLLSVTSVSNPHPSALGAALADPFSDQSARSVYVQDLLDPTAVEVFLADGGAVLRDVWVEAELSADAAEAEFAILGDPAALGAAIEWYRANFTTTYIAPGRSLVPTMLLWSTDDAPLGPDPAFRTPPLGGNSFRFEVVHGVNHWLPNIEPDLVSSLLLDFIGRPGPLGDGDESFGIELARGVAFCVGNDAADPAMGWTTLGIGPCSVAEFDALAASGEVNDTRRWVSLADRWQLDRTVEGSIAPGGVRMRLGGVFDRDPAAYEPFTGDRDESLRFDAGTQVAVLTDGDGTRWIMQAQLIGDGASSFADTGGLPALDLPSGWVVATETLDAQLIMSGDDVELMVDSAGNVYRR